MPARANAFFNALNSKFDLSGFINKWYQSLLAPVPTTGSYWHLFVGLAIGLVIVACLLQAVSHRLRTTEHE